MENTPHPSRGSVGSATTSRPADDARCGPRSPRSRAAGLTAALLAALVASSCVPPTPGPGGPGDPDPTSTTTTADPGADCARDTSLPRPGDLSLDLRITGKVVLPDGRPAQDIGRFAIVQDRRSNVGSVLAEASVNDAGFFLLAARGNAVPADIACRETGIEVCAPGSNGCDGAASLYAELDITGLVSEAAGQGVQQVDISDDPLVYERIAAE